MEKRRKTQPAITLDMPVGNDYCPDWTIVETLREVLANALDTHTAVTIAWRDGVAHIEDEGPGLRRKHLIFGRSEGKGAREIGVWGEGLKVAALVAAREQRQFVVETVGATWKAYLAPSSSWGMPTLHWEITPNQQRRGTRIQITCTETQLAEARRLFLAFRSLKEVPEAVGVYETPVGEHACIYLVGREVARVPALFSYDLTDKRLGNRSHSRVDTAAVARVVVKQLAASRSSRWIAAYLQAAATSTAYGVTADTLLEFHAPLPPVAHPDVWTAIADDLFGEKRVWGRETGALLTFADLGYRVLPSFSSQAQNALRATNTRSTWELGRPEDPTFSWVAAAQLTLQEKNVLGRAVRLTRRLMGDLVALDRVRVFERCTADAPHSIPLGFYLPDEDAIAIRRTQLRSAPQANATMLHEGAHARSQAKDYSSAFGSTLTDALGIALTAAPRKSGTRLSPATKRGWRELVREALTLCSPEGGFDEMVAAVQTLLPQNSSSPEHLAERVLATLREEGLLVA